MLLVLYLSPFLKVDLVSESLNEVVEATSSTFPT